MKILGIETSSSAFSVAASERGEGVSFLQVEGQGRPSALLTDLIDRALRQAGWTLTDLDALAVSIGPGSFTGLRVGVMTVKTLGWALKKPVLPVSSLEVMAQNGWERTGPILSFVDARKGKVYSAPFSAGGKLPVRRLGEDRLLPPEEALREAPEGGLVIGDGLRRYEELVRSHGGGKLLLAQDSLWTPRADHLCALAAAAWPAGRLDDPHSLVPHYLYSRNSDIVGW